MVFLNSLFSAIVASFIIEIYKTLLLNNGQSAANTSSAVRINIVLFLSFFLSMMSAVGCALIQQWCDEYKKFCLSPGRSTYAWACPNIFVSRPQSFPDEKVHERDTRPPAYLSLPLLLGPQRLLLHRRSLFCVSPLIFINSPYNTPMTHPLRATYIILLLIIIRSPLWLPRSIRRKPFDLTGLQYYKGIQFDRALLYSIEAGKQAKELEPYAMKWLFTDNDFSDSDMDKFLESFPGYMSSNHTEKGQMDEYLTAGHIKSRIRQHFMTCATSVELSDQASIARMSSCVKALVLIFRYSRERKGGSSEPDKLKSEI